MTNNMMHEWAPAYLHRRSSYSCNHIMYTMTYYLVRTKVCTKTCLFSLSYEITFEDTRDIHIIAVLNLEDHKITEE
jgi:pyrrolidone-carboxylate peptidase